MYLDVYKSMIHLYKLLEYILFCMNFFIIVIVIHIFYIFLLVVLCFIAKTRYVAPFAAIETQFYIWCGKELLHFFVKTSLRHPSLWGSLFVRFDISCIKRVVT